MLLKNLNIIAFLLLSSFVQSDNFPLKVAEIQTNNTIVNYKGQKLILVDFWATWCGPCRIAGKQLEYLQEKFRNEVFMISITDETHEVVEKFLKKHPARLMIVRDIVGNIFKKYNVRSRPYAILFTAEGKIVWQGHPSGLTENRIRKYARRNSRVKGLSSVEEFLSVDKIEKESPEEDENEFFIKPITEPNSMIVKKKHSIDYYGSIGELVAYLNQVPQHFVKGNKADSLYVHVKSPLKIWENSPNTVLDLLKHTFRIDILEVPSVENVIYLTLEGDEKLWDANQIDWGEDALSNHIVGEDRIQADNVSIDEFCVLLSDVKKKTYRYAGNNIELHDWDVHFNFDDLMETEFMNEYGIKFEEKQSSVTYFYIE